MKILLDGSAAVIGSRAIKRYTNSLIKEFILLNKKDEFKILLNYFRGNSKSIDALIQGKPTYSKIRFPIPRSISIPFWNAINFPPIDFLTGKVDIFHSLGDDCPPLKSGKYIVTLHGITYLEVPELMDSDYVKYKKAWLYKMTKRSDFFISVSEHTKKEFLKYFSYIDPDKIRVIPLGIDQKFRVIDKELVRKQLLKKYKITKQYVLYVGGIEPRKNVKNIVKSFCEISDKYPNFILILVGSVENNYRSSLDSLIRKLGLDNRIRFIGYVEQESDDLPILYNGAECFIYPSFSEGWTSPPLEAMACGTPVITSDVSSLPETVGNAASLVNPNNYTAIGTALRNILNGSDLKNNLIRKGLQHVYRYTWKRCAEETYRFYNSVIESG